MMDVYGKFVEDGEFLLMIDFNFVLFVEEEFWCLWEMFVLERNLGDGFVGELVYVKQVVILFFFVCDNDVFEVVFVKFVLEFVIILLMLFQKLKVKWFVSGKDKVIGFNKDVLVVVEEDENDEDSGVEVFLSKKQKMVKNNNVVGKVFVRKMMGGKGVSKKVIGKSVKEGVMGKVKGGRRKF